MSKEELKEKGIIIVAVGHSNYYRMAEVLAASLKCNAAAGIDLTLICDNITKIRYRNLFDGVIEVGSHTYTNKEGKVVFNKLMVQLYDLSPYKTTIKLDADMVWLRGRDPNDLFRELHGEYFTFMNRGWGELTEGSGYSVWASETKIKQTYHIEDGARCYKIYGEFLYFRKNSEMKKFFGLIKKLYRERKVKAHVFANDEYTDELAYQVACMMTGKYPHKDNFTPIFNSFLGYKDLEHTYTYKLAELGYWAYSIGGHYNTQFQKTQYNNLASFYFNALGLQNPYKVMDKKSFLVERNNL